MNHDLDEVTDADARAQRSAGLTAGLALAAMALIAPFAVFGAVGAMITPGNATRTVQDIAGSDGLFRLGIAGLILVVILDVVAAAALYRLFEPVDRTVSIMAAWFRLGYAAVYLVAIIQLVLALGRLGVPDQAMQAVEAYHLIWHLGLILFGVHLLLIGYLGYRSRYLPRIFGVLLVIAGLGYLADGFGAVLVPGYSISIGAFTFVGEVALIFWLLIKGRRHHFNRGSTDRFQHREPDLPVLSN